MVASPHNNILVIQMHEVNKGLIVSILHCKYFNEGSTTHAHITLNRLHLTITIHYIIMYMYTKTQDLQD